MGREGREAWVDLGGSFRQSFSDWGNRQVIDEEGEWAWRPPGTSGPGSLFPFTPVSYSLSSVCYDMVTLGSIQGLFELLSTVILEILPEVSELTPLSAGNHYSTLM